MKKPKPISFWQFKQWLALWYGPAPRRHTRIDCLQFAKKK